MRSPRLWLGLLISAASILFLVWSVDFGELWAALASANPLLVVACVATLPVTMYMKMCRWRLFFPEPSRVSTRGLLSALYVGYMANTVLPLRVGEILRAYLVGESERVRVSTVLATVLIEKVLDLGTIALFLVVISFLLPLPDWAAAAALASSAGLVMASGGLAVALLARGLAIRVAGLAEGKLGLLKQLQLVILLESFLDGLAFVRKPRVLAAVIVWSVVMWVAAAITMYLGLAALGIGTPFGVAVFVLTVTNLGMAVPSAPGYVGVFHSAVVVSLAPFAVDASQALAAAIVIHAAVFGTFIVGGLYFLIRGQLGQLGEAGLGGLVARAQSAAHEAQPH